MIVKIKPLKGKVFIKEIQRGERMWGRIILRNDDGTAHGVRSRWAKVYAIGDDITDISVGEYVLLKHGRWTRAYTIEDENNENITVHAIDYPSGILVVCDEIPTGWEELFGDQTVKSEHLSRNDELTISERTPNIREY